MNTVQLKQIEVCSVCSIIEQIETKVQTAMRWSPDRPAPLMLAAIPLCAVLLISLSYFHDRFRTFHLGVGQFALLSSPDADGDSTLVAAHALRFTTLGAIRNDSALDVDLVVRTNQGLVHGVTDGEFPDVRAYRGYPSQF